MDVCRFKGIAIADGNNGVKIVSKMRCKLWSCDYCAQKNAEIWRAILLRSVSEIDTERRENGIAVEWSFMTITLPSQIHAIGDGFERNRKSVDFFRENWDKLAKRLKRWLGKFQYVRVLENHKTGVLHAHLLASTFVPDSEKRRHKGGDREEYWHSDTLEKHLLDTGFGYIHDARNLYDDNDEGKNAIMVASYVAKYISKGLGDIEQAREKARVRKIQTSRAFQRDKFRGGSALKWSVKLSGLSIVEFQGMKDRGISICTSSGTIITADDFNEDGIYYGKV